MQYEEYAKKSARADMAAGAIGMSPLQGASIKPIGCIQIALDRLGGSINELCLIDQRLDAVLQQALGPVPEEQSGSKTVPSVGGDIGRLYEACDMIERIVSDLSARATRLERL